MIAFLRQLIVWIVAVALLVQGVGLSQPAQAIPLQLGSSTSTKVVTLLDSNNSKILGENNKYVSLATEAVNKDSLLKGLVFSDTDEFYKELTTALKSGEPVQIITDYTSYDDFPPRLKQIFKPDADTIPINALGAAAAAAINTPVAQLIPSPSMFASIPAKIDYKWLIIPVSTAFGAGAGAAIGLPTGGIGTVPGALVGGGVGLAAGAVTVAMMDNKHQVRFEIDIETGKFVIVVIPVS
jgi:hypothetical protein